MVTVCSLMVPKLGLHLEDQGQLGYPHDQVFHLGVPFAELEYF